MNTHIIMFLQKMQLAILEKVGLIECKLIEIFLPLQSMMFHMIVQREDIFYQQILILLRFL